MIMPRDLGVLAILSDLKNKPYNDTNIANHRIFEFVLKK